MLGQLRTGSVDEEGVRARAWRIYLVVGTLAVVGYFLLPDDWWQTSANAAIGLAGAAGLLVGVKLYRPHRAGLWWMLAGGLLSIAAGDFGATAEKNSACSCPAPPPNRPPRCWSGYAR